MAQSDPEVSKALKDYITKAAKSGTLSVEGLQDLMQKYNAAPIVNAPDVVDFYKKHGTINPNLVTSYESAAGPSPSASLIPGRPQDALSSMPVLAEPQKIRDVVAQQNDTGYAGNLARSVAKGALFDFNDELEAAARMLAEGKIDATEYRRIKNQINTDYGKWSEANPKAALGGELAGGIASTFIPGVGWVGKGVQSATKIGKIANVTGRAAATGALSGAVSGVGSAPTMQDIPADALIGAGMGTAGGVILPTMGRAGLRLYEAGRNRLTGAVAPDAAAQRAAEITIAALTRSGVSPKEAAQRVAMRRTYNIPEIFGQATPELERTTEAVVSKPSAGREGLITRLVTRQQEAPQRVARKLQTAFDDPKSFFQQEDEIAKNLEGIGANEYAKARAFGEVKDPVIQRMLETDPDLAKAFEDATASAQSQMTAAIGRGEDPSKYKLTDIYEPVFDKAGNPTGGHKFVGNVPDVNTLDRVKRALDARINTLYRTDSGKATDLKVVRKALVDRLDTLVPDYKAARAKYAGELEVRDALRTGATVFSKAVHPEQLNKAMQGMSEAEEEALRIGAFKAVMQPIETTAKARNFADEIVNNPQAREKLRLLLPPEQFAVMSAALDREAQVYKGTSKILGGSRTAPLLKEGQNIDDAISSGNINDVVSVLTNPSVGSLARFGGKILGLMKNQNFESDVYTHLAKIMKSGTPQELAETLNMLQTHAAAAGRKAAVENQAAGRAATVAGTVAQRQTAQPPYVLPPRVSNVRQPHKMTLDEIMETGAKALNRTRDPVEGPPEPPVPAENVEPGPDLQ